MTHALRALKPAILLLFFLFSATTAMAQTREVYSPSDGYLNLRTGPSTQYQIIQPMYNGQRVSILDQSRNWWKVQLPNGTIGWAFARYLIKLPTQSAVYPTKQIYSPNDGYLNLRTGPSTRYPVIQRMYNGKRVSILERNGRWLRVRLFNGTQGWAYGKYLVD